MVGEDEPGEPFLASHIVDPYIDRSFDGVAKGGVIHTSAKPRDDLGVDQALHSSPCCIWAQANSAPEFNLGHST